MSILCSILGHKPPVYAEKGWYSPGQEYGKLSHFEADGIKRVHAYVEGECARCGESFRMARVHLPSAERVGQFERGNYSEYQAELRERDERKRIRNEG